MRQPLLERKAALSELFEDVLHIAKTCCIKFVGHFIGDGEALSGRSSTSRACCASPTRTRPIGCTKAGYGLTRQRVMVDDKLVWVALLCSFERGHACQPPSPGGSIKALRSRQISCTKRSVSPYSPWPRRITTLATISSLSTA